MFANVEGRTGICVGSPRVDFAGRPSRISAVAGSRVVVVGDVASRIVQVGVEGPRICAEVRSIVEAS